MNYRSLSDPPECTMLRYKGIKSISCRPKTDVLKQVVWGNVINHGIMSELRGGKVLSFQSCGHC